MPTSMGIIIYIIGAILLGVHLLISRAKSDKIVGELVTRPKEQELKDTAELAQLTQEIQDAKIDYKADAERVRRDYLDSRGK